MRSWTQIAFVLAVLMGLVWAAALPTIPLGAPSTADSLASGIATDDLFALVEPAPAPAGR